MPRVIPRKPPSPARARTAPEEGFLEVNPKSTSPAFQKYIDAALRELRASNTEVARVTLHMIESGKVRIDTLDDLVRADYLRERKSLLKDGVTLPAHADLHDHHARAFRAIAKDLDGYMWDDRIYVSPGLSPKHLAATLVHEVNHVLNASEEHYRGDDAVLREEYRAFYAEAWFEHGRRPTSAECARIKAGVVRDYELQCSPDDVADVPPGLFAPG